VSWLFPSALVSPFILGVCILLWSEATQLETSQNRNQKNAFVTWNVGQGLWTTLVEDGVCLHFDAGGERAPWKAIKTLCASKQNMFSFSHWDMDHIDFIAKAAKRLGQSCLLHMPQGPSTPRKRRFFEHIQTCDSNEAMARHLKEIDQVIAPRRSQKKAAKQSNEFSRVFVIEERILAPGDSTRKEEQRWATAASHDPIQLLILGHHGSKTSTSPALLRNLHFAAQAIASCRKARYGHPHAEVLARLKKAGIATISTEDWGSIFWQLPNHTTSSAAASGSTFKN
jgi:competence protein ComEC